MKSKALGLSISLFMLIAACCAETVTIVDFTGREVEVSAPVNTTISLSGAASEILWALDGGQSMVGRSSSSDFPPLLENVTVVGSNSNSPDLELIMELKPGLVIADTMLSDEDRQVLEEDGIAVVVERFIDPYRTLSVIDNLGRALGKEERAQELSGLLEGYQDLIKERTGGIAAEDRPTVFFEWLGRPYFSASSGTSYGNFIDFAGASNIAANESVNYPNLSPEWVIERDPDIILHILGSSEQYSEEDLKEWRDEIMARPELQNLRAVKDGRVYVLSGTVATGVRSSIGELYLAKWFYPELFEAIDPGTEHEKLIRNFYDMELEGEFAYPTKA
ncbi:MAG: ABC transporter substrate-binding protein [Methanotrichaceae archaeon]|nr:ABC transporter substrate-binding protein [Methanotrichaceae archaeon]